jgi:septal ring factor EnvC (AmiA/AmiB activator)
VTIDLDELDFNPKAARVHYEMKSRMDAEAELEKLRRELGEEQAERADALARLQVLDQSIAFLEHNIEEIEDALLHHS